MVLNYVVLVRCYYSFFDIYTDCFMGSYMNLLGDPLHLDDGEVKPLRLRDFDSAFIASVTAGDEVVQTILNDLDDFDAAAIVADNSMMNVVAYLTMRMAVERYLIMQPLYGFDHRASADGFMPSIKGHFNNVAGIHNDLCISKNPTAEQVQHSVSDFSQAAKKVKNRYQMLRFGQMGLVTLSAFSSDDALRSIYGGLVGGDGFVFQRSVRGAHRFNKIASGQWALIDIETARKEMECEAKELHASSSDQGLVFGPQMP